jgi:hypothetical protein
MKKLLILFIAIALVISLAAFSCDNKAQSNDVSGDTEEGNTAKTSNNTPAVENLADWMMSGTYYMKYTADVEAGGATMTMKGVMAAQGGNIATTSEMNVAGQAVKSRMIAVDGTTYIIDDSLKIIMKSPVNITEANQETAHYSKMKKTGSGTGTVKGKTLPYEEYQGEGYTSKFYIDNGRVYAIETTGKSGKSLLIIEEESKTVPRGSFDLPNGYMSL